MIRVFFSDHSGVMDSGVRDHRHQRVLSEHGVCGLDHPQLVAQRVDCVHRNPRVSEGHGGDFRRAGQSLADGKWPHWSWSHSIQRRLG